MFKKILVGTDGSVGSKAALARAAEMAKASKCEIILLNVTLSLEAFWGYSPYGEHFDNEKLVEMGQKIIEETMADIDFEGLKLTTKVRLGSPELEIIDEADDENVDLIALGIRGTGLFSGTVLGTVADRVLKTALCPVLIVKDPETVRKLKAHNS